MNLELNKYKNPIDFDERNILLNLLSFILF